MVEAYRRGFTCDCCFRLKIWHSNAARSAFESWRTASLCSSYIPRTEGNTMSRRRLRSRIELLESRVVLTAVTFSEQPSLVEFGVGGRVDEVTVADFDGDGLVEILVAGGEAEQPTTLQILKRIDGEYVATEILVGQTFEYVSNFRVGDVDGDGDADVVARTSDQQGLEHVWFENVNGQGQFIQRDVPLDGDVWISQVLDVNGDGRVDLVATLDESLVVLYSESSGFGEPTAVLESTSDRFDFKFNDIDGDADADLFFRTNESGFGMRRNELGTFADFNLITPNGEGVGGNAIFRDLDGDGDRDIAIGRHRIVNNGNGNLELLEGEFEYWPWVLEDLDADYDSDGDVDTIGVGPGYRHQLFENTGEAFGGFRPTLLLPPGQHWSSLDVDGDGDQDILQTLFEAEQVVGLSWLANVPNVTVDVIGGHQQVESASVVPYQLVVSNFSGEEVSATVELGENAWPISDWTCEALHGATCPASGTDLSVSTSLPAQSQLVFHFSIAFPETAVGPQDVTGSISIVGQGSPITDTDVVYVRPAAFPFAEPTGIFARAQQFPDIMSEYYDMQAGDFDRDGDIDLLVVGYQIDMLENDGVGRFEPVHVGYASAHAATSGDVDNDGDLDLVTVGYDHVQLWRNERGKFMQAEIVANNDGYGVELADFDGDGKLDLLYGASDGVHLAINSGDATSQEFHEPRLVHEAADARLAVGDIDNDGDTDVYIRPMSDGGDFLLSNDGTANFMATEQPGIGGESVELIDLDGDGNLDVVGMQVRWNDGEGFVDGPQFSDVSNLVTADFDGDGDLDVVSMYELKVWLNQGERAFALTEIPGLNDAMGSTIAVADFNGDGDIDIATSSYDGTDIYSQVETSSDLAVEVAPFDITVDADGYHMRTTITVTHATAEGGSAETEFSNLPFQTEVMGLSSFDWTCTATGESVCQASGSGPIEDLIQVGNGEQLVYHIEGVIADDANLLAVDANIDHGWYFEDVSPENDRSLVNSIDSDRSIEVTRSDIRVDEDGEHQVTYTVHVRNSEHYRVVGLGVEANPIGLTEISWTCEIDARSCGDGEGLVSESIDLDAGGVAIYTISGRMDSEAQAIEFDARISTPFWLFNDAKTWNNHDYISGISSDISVRVDANQIGTEHVYDIVVRNEGPDTVATTVSGTPNGLLNPTWTCETVGAGNCTASGEGAIEDQILLEGNSRVTYRVQGIASASVDRSSFDARLNAPDWLLNDARPDNNESSGSLTVVPLVVTSPAFAHPTNSVVIVLTRPQGDIDTSENLFEVSFVGSQSGSHDPPVVTQYPDRVEIESSSQFTAGEKVTFEVRGIRTTDGVDIKTYRGQVQIAATESTGAFTSAGKRFQSPVQATADVDGDGDLDVVAGNLWMNDGTGNFEDTGIAFAPTANSIQLADLNADGWLDVYADQPQANLIFLSQPDGSYVSSEPSHGNANTRSSILVDVDFDGDIDVVSAAPNADGVSTTGIWLNDGLGIFTEKSHDFGATFHDQGFVGISADVEGDGDADLIFTTSSAKLALHSNTADGFVRGLDIYVQASDIDVGDIDGDGDLDFLLHVDRFQATRIWRNNGNNRLSFEVGFTSGYQGELLDADGDGDLDAVLGVDGQLGVFLNNGSGRFVDTLSRFGSKADAIAVGDFDGDGDMDVISNDELFLNASPDDTEILGDLTGDGEVGFADFLVLSKNFGATDASFADGDLNDDSSVDFADFLILSKHFGTKR